LISREFGWIGGEGAVTNERAFARIRRERGWSLDCAAALLWISPTYLRRLERGAVPLSLLLAERMAGVYGVDLNALVAVAA
jgi:transcriptional regulator with XRE-family HTH domain